MKGWRCDCTSKARESRTALLEVQRRVNCRHKLRKCGFVSMSSSLHVLFNPFISFPLCFLSVFSADVFMSGLSVFEFSLILSCPVKSVSLPSLHQLLPHAMVLDMCNDGFELRNWKPLSQLASGTRARKATNEDWTAQQCWAITSNSGLYTYRVCTYSINTLSHESYEAQQPRQACGMKGCSCTCELTSRISTKPGHAEGSRPIDERKQATVTSCGAQIWISSRASFMSLSRSIFFQPFPSISIPLTPHALALCILAEQICIILNIIY